MREYSWVVGVPRGARADDVRRVHQEVVRRRRAVVARRGPTADRMCEVLRAYEVSDALPTVRFPTHGSTRPPRDEVAIDFPSLSETLERIARGFEEPDAPRVAQVRLSWREASRGAHVALEVPVRCTCLVCGGRGEVWDEPCSLCRGSGTEPHRHLVRLSIPAGIRSGARFRFTVNPPYAAETSVEVRVSIR